VNRGEVQSLLLVVEIVLIVLSIIYGWYVVLLLAGLALTINLVQRRWFG